MFGICPDFSKTSNCKRIIQMSQKELLYQNDKIIFKPETTQGAVKSFRVELCHSGTTMYGRLRLFGLNSIDEIHTIESIQYNDTQATMTIKLSDKSISIRLGPQDSLSQSRGKRLSVGIMGDTPSSSLGCSVNRRSLASPINEVTPSPSPIPPINTSDVLVSPRTRQRMVILNTRREGHDSRVDELQRDVERLKEGMKNAVTSLLAANATVRDMKQHIERQEADIAKLKQVVTAQTAIIKKYEKEQLKQLERKDMTQSLERKITQLQSQIEVIERNSQQHQQEIQMNKEHMETASSSILSEVNELKEQHARVKSELHELQQVQSTPTRSRYNSFSGFPESRVVGTPVVCHTSIPSFETLAAQAMSSIDSVTAQSGDLTYIALYNTTADASLKETLASHMSSRIVVDFWEAITRHLCPTHVILVDDECLDLNVKTATMLFSSSVIICASTLPSSIPHAIRYTTIGGLIETLTSSIPS